MSERGAPAGCAESLAAAADSSPPKPVTPASSLQISPTRLVMSPSQNASTEVAIAEKGSPASAVKTAVARFPVYPVGVLVALIAALFVMWRFMTSRFTLQRRPPKPPN